MILSGNILYSQDLYSFKQTKCEKGRKKEPIHEHTSMRTFNLFSYTTWTHMNPHKLEYNTAFIMHSYLQAILHLPHPHSTLMKEDCCLWNLYKSLYNPWTFSFLHNHKNALGLLLCKKTYCPIHTHVHWITNLIPASLTSLVCCKKRTKLTHPSLYMCELIYLNPNAQIIANHVAMEFSSCLTFVSSRARPSYF